MSPIPNRHLKKYSDCETHGVGSGAELFIVEGDSAARSVSAVRNARTQAVLPIQGKPPNAYKASPKSVRANPFFDAVGQCLGMTLRKEAREVPEKFERVCLLLDPDADGIHCGALLLLFFYLYLRPLLASRRLLQIHAPTHVIQVTGESPQQVLAFSDEEARQLSNSLAGKGILSKRRYHRGLGSIAPDILRTTCVAPATRNARVLTEQDAEMCIQVFGGGQ